MTRTRKDDIQISYHQGTRGLPMVNVKVYHWPILDVSEKAAQFAWESQQDRFWEEVEDAAREIWHHTIKVYSAGHGGGYAVVSGLHNVESWDAIDVAKWSRFEKWCKMEIEYLTNKEELLDLIEANRWNEEGAEEFNFFDSPDGETICISEMKLAAIEAGFGPVIRK